MSILGNTKKTTNEQRKSAKLPKLSIQQQIDNQQVIERMNRKITFTKNQRHLGKTLQYVEALSTENISNIFRIQPQQLLFTDYQSHHTYQGQIKLVNKTKVLQRIKITPLKTKQYVISSVKYPKQNTGDIAPGMTVSIFVRFRPVNLHDYEDELIIITSDGITKVPILAQRQKCQGKWPQQIDCGHCWVGDKNNKQIQINNKGGQAVYKIKNEQNAQKHEIGFFEVIPAEIKVGKNTNNLINVTFSPERQGRFNETVTFVSDQGDDEEVVIHLVGGAYTARITLQEINQQKVRVQKFNNYLYLKNCEPGRTSISQFKIKNHAVVPVDYFWYIEDDRELKINHTWGKILPSEIFQFEAIMTPLTREPRVINASLYLYNLPKQSISTTSITKKVNGVDAIQCLKLQIRSSSQVSPIEVFPLHKKIPTPMYKGHHQEVKFTVVNNSSTQRKVSVHPVKEDEFCRAQCLLQNEQFLKPNSQMEIVIRFLINQLSKVPQKAYFLVNFDNAPSEMISVQGSVEFPNLRLFTSEVDFGLVRTNSHFVKKFKVLNQGLNDVFFRIINPHRFYQLDFYDMYEFQSDEFYIDRLQILTGIGECKDWVRVPAKSESIVEFRLHTIDPETIDMDVDLQIMNGATYKINVSAQAQLIVPTISRNNINIKEMYKGNLYNSNKFLSKELAIINEGNMSFSYEIIPPQTDKCNINLTKLTGVVQAKSKKRLDLVVQPIKTGEFKADYVINYFDNIPIYSEDNEDDMGIRQFAQEKRKVFFKKQSLTLQSTIKGVQINYYLKDESRAKKVRQKVQQPQGSVKLSSYSFKSTTKSQYLQSERTVYPSLQELNFFNCQINKVQQMEIFIQNDSGLTAEYQIFAENFHTNERAQTKPMNSSKGFNQNEEEAFTSEMGKTFLQARVLDKAQKIHLSNNKGISIMCEPSSGHLYKKQTQKIILTMFNDTSGRFKDNLVISVKDHEVKKFPINLNIKGTPVSLSRNQLGINFNKQTPSLHTGTHLVHNGNASRNIKVVNNGPKEVLLQWLFYPYANSNSDKDLFQIKFEGAEHGSDNIVQTKWMPIKPQLDQNPPFSVEPKQKVLKGRQEVNFILTTKEPLSEGQFKNLLIAKPFIIEKQSKRQMESLAVVLSGEGVLPFLKIDQKHSNHLNKFQKYAIEAPQNATTANNSYRKIKLKNPHKSNLTFRVDVETLKSRDQSFEVVFTDSNSPLTKFQKLPQKTLLSSKTKFNEIQRQFTLDYESFVQIGIEIVANPKDFDSWPLEQKIRKDGILKIMYSNGDTQQIKLVGWLYRPWIQIQMPNNLFFSHENFLIDFGTVHVKNYKKMSIYISNPSKSTAHWNINYVKYHQTKKIKFQKQLWTDVDYEDETITDEKKCFRLSQDSGKIYGQSIPIHYMPGTLALPSKDDQYAQSHKPDKVDIVFKPELNVLYKSKFVVSSQFGETFTLIVKGKGTYEEQKQIK